MSINDFMKKMAMDIRTSDREFSKDDYYYILKYLGVKKDNSLVEDIETFYQDFLDNLSNSLVKYEAKRVKTGENATYYIGFYVDKKANYKEAVKLYFPVKYEYLISALKTIFLYLIRNSVKATVKFCVKATNENIVIRFYDEKEVMPFINYCNSNFILEDLLVPCNPFIAKMHGLGLVKDDNTINTYNGTLSVLLEEYFRLLKENNSLDKASGLDFLDYIRKRKMLEEGPEQQFNMEAIEKNIMTILEHKKVLD